MTASDRAAAQAALNDGRPVYGRLDQIRGPEDAAADIMELWASGEAAMRALLGGSSLSGQDLVRELRQRGVINLEQANSLASFWDARSRANDVAYKPTLTDVGFARAGYNELTRVTNDTSSPITAAAPGASSFAPGASTAASIPASPNPPPLPPASPTPGARGVTRPVDAAIGTPAVRRRTSTPMLIAAGVAALIIIVAAVAFLSNRPSGFDADMASAISLMQTGRTEAARAAFGAVAHQYPDRAAPHVFLSRLARDDSPPDMNTARQELVTAIRLEPAYEPAQREMGIFQLADHNPALARNFLLRAVQLTPDDSAAQGYLGCALVGLNQADVAQRFLSRAGSGTWSTCATATPQPARRAAP
ncbi:MAG: hypothetical protein M3R65_06080 [Gemmatimonadota bacterium]|nr:hypothetical protein [Gemmatimonadota bacterium]